MVTKKTRLLIHIALAKPSKASQTQSQISSAGLAKSNSQQQLVRRDSSFMGSVLHDLSISSQSSDSSTSAMSTLHDPVRSSTPLKRPSSDALDEHNDHGRVDVLRARTSTNTFGDKRVDRLTLPHTGPSIVQQRGAVQSISTQARTIRTVSRFFLSSVPVKKKNETPLATQENASIDRLLLAQKDRLNDKVLQGIKAKFGMDKPVRKSSRCIYVQCCFTMLIVNFLIGKKYSTTIFKRAEHEVKLGKTAITIPM
jgi:hypothetical protein